MDETINPVVDEIQDQEPTTDKNAEILAKIKAGGTVKLEEPLIIDNGCLDLSNINDLVLDLNGFYIESNDTTNGDTIDISKSTVTIKNGEIKPSRTPGDSGAILYIMAGTHLTLENVTINGVRAVYGNGTNSTVVIKSGKYHSPATEGAEAIYVQKGTSVVIEGGQFSSSATGKKFTINLKDDLMPTDDTDIRQFISVKGGEFDIHPGDTNTEKHPSNFVADGYVVGAFKNGTFYAVAKEGEEYAESIDGYPIMWPEKQEPEDPSTGGGEDPTEPDTPETPETPTRPTLPKQADPNADRISYLGFIAEEKIEKGAAIGQTQFKSAFEPGETFGEYPKQKPEEEPTQDEE